MEIKIQANILVSKRIDGKEKNEEEFQMLVPQTTYKVLPMQMKSKLEKQVNVPKKTFRSSIRI